jgi:hypothetical protein
MKGQAYIEGIQQQTVELLFLEAISSLIGATSFPQALTE